MNHDFIQYPTMYTKPLTDPIYSPKGDRLILFVEKYWIDPNTNKKLILDAYQKWLLRSILEQFPQDHENPNLAGKLRYRQVVISMGRQNGKSIIAAILTAFGLFQHVNAPLIIGVAFNREQAKIVYERTKYVIQHNKALHKLVKPTTTRGLSFRDGRGFYEFRTGRSASLQGVPITLGVCDELHILEEGTWDAMLIGQRAQEQGLLVGITTAGDDGSLLLKRLYKQGERAVQGDNQRFGFFLWEAPEGSTIDDHQAIFAANPSIACGRIPIETVLSDIKDAPQADLERYTFNRFIAAINPWLPTHLWTSAQHGEIQRRSNPLVLSVDVTPDWTYASLVIATKDPETNRLTTQLVESINQPTPQKIVEEVRAFKRKNSYLVITMDKFTLNNVAEELERKGIRVKLLSQADVIGACEQVYAMLSQGRVSHRYDPLVMNQVPKGKRKNVGEHWRISRGDSLTTEIDALMATVFALYTAETSPKQSLGLY